MRNRTAYIWAAVIFIGVAVGLLAYYNRHSDRFGDPAVLEQIKSSTDCDELHRWSDAVLQASADHASSDEMDKAIGYSNAADERLKALRCS